MIIILDLRSDDVLYYIIIYMIINFLIEACFLGYIGAMLIFLVPYYIIYIYYIRIRILFDDPILHCVQGYFYFSMCFWANQEGM